MNYFVGSLVICTTIWLLFYIEISSQSVGLMNWGARGWTISLRKNSYPIGRHEAARGMGNSPAMEWLGIGQWERKVLYIEYFPGWVAGREAVIANLITLFPGRNKVPSNDGAIGHWVILGVVQPMPYGGKRQHKTAWQAFIHIHNWYMFTVAITRSRV